MAARELIVNADDFGRSLATNDGVVRAHEHGIVTTASLMVRWPGAEAAAAYARRTPSLGVGLHVDLSEWTYRDGEWVIVYDHGPAESEIDAQLELFRRLLGRDPTHLDSHQHVHRSEPVSSLLAARAQALGLPLRETGPVTYCGDFYGQSGHGERYPDGITVYTLLAIITALPEGVTELGCHPGLDAGLDSSYRDERLIEVETLCDPRVRAALDDAGVRLRRFAEDPVPAALAPAAGASSAAPPVHAAAATGFDRAAADYERGRPGYPTAALEHLTATLDLRPGRTVLDLAAGTGKLTRLLLGTGARVIAVEPVAGMRAQLTASAPELELHDGTAEAIPLADRSCDAVTVAQAFHWFNAPAAAAEIHRVLVPDGRLAVIWNAWDEDVPWVAEVMAIVHAHTGSAPQQLTSTWPDQVRATGLFGHMHEVTFVNVVHGDRDTLVARVLSTSYIAALQQSGRQQVARDVRAVADRHPQTAGQATLAMPYTTHVVWAERR